MAALAEATEERLLRQALDSAERAMALAQQDKVTKAELARTLYFLGQYTKAAVDVAGCRGERIPLDD